MIYLHRWNRYAITELYNVTEERYVMAIFVDIQNVFDSLCWPALMADLKQRDCHRNLYLIIKDYLPMEYGYYIVDRQVKRGCPHVSVLG